MDTINLTPIFQAIIALLAALITYRLIPWIKARTSEDQQRGISAMLRTLVFAAEQIYGAGNGEEKLNYVCQQLRERGYEVSLPEIEATVYEAFNQFTPKLGSGNTYVLPDDAAPDIEITHWPLEQLKSFCELNGVPCEGCETREDYIDAIGHWGENASECKDYCEIEGKEPPSGAAEGREE